MIERWRGWALTRDQLKKRQRTKSLVLFFSFRLISFLRSCGIWMRCSVRWTPQREDTARPGLRDVRASAPGLRSIIFAIASIPDEQEPEPEAAGLHICLLLLARRR